MDKLTVETTFPRSKPVHFPGVVTAKPFFWSISVQLDNGIGFSPLHPRSLHAENGGYPPKTGTSVHFSGSLV